LRNLLGDSGPNMITSLIRTMQGSTSMHGALSFLFGVPSCLRLPPAARTEVNRVLQQVKHPDLMYTMLLSNYQVVQIMRPRKLPLYAEDLLILMNTVTSSTYFQRCETSFQPLCLPKFMPDGMVHALVSYIAPNLCLILVTNKVTALPDLQGLKDQIVQGLTSVRVLPTLTAAAANPHFSIADLTPYDLRHFVYKNFTFNQFAAPAFEPPLVSKASQSRLFQVYQNIHTRLHKGTRAHRIYYHVSTSETVLAWLTSEFQLFATFGPLTTKAQATQTCNRLNRWLKREEESLFSHVLLL